MWGVRKSEWCGGFGLSPWKNGIPRNCSTWDTMLRLLFCFILSVHSIHTWESWGQELYSIHPILFRKWQGSPLLSSPLLWPHGRMTLSSPPCCGSWGVSATVRGHFYTEYLIARVGLLLLFSFLSSWLRDHMFRWRRQGSWVTLWNRSPNLNAFSKKYNFVLWRLWYHVTVTKLY